MYIGKVACFHDTFCLLLCSSWQYEAELGLYSTKACCAAAQHDQPTGNWHFSLSGLVTGTAELGQHAARPVPTAAADVSMTVQRPEQLSATPAATEAVELSIQSSHSLQQAGTTASEQPSNSQDGRKHTEAWLAASSTAGGKEEPILLEPVAFQVLRSGGATLSTPRMPAALGDASVCRVTVASLNGTAAGSGSRLVHVSGNHIGTYAFKGCGAMDMVCLTSDVILAPEAQAQSRCPPRGAKGEGQQQQGSTEVC